MITIPSKDIVHPRILERTTWPDTHMLMALLAARRSPDPNSQVGACVIDSKNRMLGTGYNGAPRGISVRLMPWAREGDDPSETKYAYVVHAEPNAIHNSSADVEGATMYATMFPCNNCAKDIIQAGISELVFLTDPYKGTWSHRVAKDMLQQVDIRITQHKWSQSALTNLQEIMVQVSV